MAETDVLTTLLANPQFVAALIAVLWNIGGYIAAMLRIKGLEKYEVTKLAETLVLLEVLFTVVSTVGGLPVKYTVVVAIILVFVRSLINAIKDYTKAVEK